jgi:hypothetical protein
MAEVPAEAESPADEPIRRHYLLDRGFQLKYAAVMALAGLAVAAIFGLWVHQAHAQATALLAPDPETRALLEKSDRVLLGVLAGIAALLAAALGLLGVVITHRVAGPVFVMGHYLDVIARGRYPRMRTLRRSDELRRFFAVFLAAVEALKARERRHAEVLEDAAHRMRGVVSRAPELAPAIDALETAAAERRLALAADSPELTPIGIPAPKAGGAR